jgi:hypothetical protein
MLFMSDEDIITSMFLFESCDDSINICRHTPHGETILFDGDCAPLPMTAMREKVLQPIAEARTIAERSAHTATE